MKKSILVLVIFVLCMTSLVALTACNNDNECAVQKNEKYIMYDHSVSSPLEKYCTYTFGNDGFGIYSYTYKATDTFVYIPDGQNQYFEEFKFGYKIYFKYTYLDKEKETVMAFYDSVTLNSDNTLDESNYSDWIDYSDWRNMLTLSKDVIIEVSQDGEINYYIREGYLSEIPNYDISK